MHLAANTHFVSSSNELALAARPSEAEGSRDLFWRHDTNRDVSTSFDMTAMTVAPLSAIPRKHSFKRCA